MESILLEEKCISHAGGRASERPVAAHGHSIAVGGDAPVGEPVGRVAQLAGVDDVLLAGTAPYPVVALGQIVHVRHPALQPHRLRRDELPSDAAVQTHPPHRCAGAGQTAIEPLAAGVGPDPQGVLAGVADDAVAVQPTPLPGLLCARAAEGYGVLGPEICADALGRNAAAVQHHRRPVARRLAVNLQRALAAPWLLRVLHPEEELPILRIFRLRRAAAAHLVDPALGVAGGKLHAGVRPRPHRPQCAHLPADGVEGQLVREDQNFCPDAHQRLFSVLHRVL